MKNRFFFLIFFLLISCNNPNQKFEINIEDLKSEGSVLITNQQLKNENNEIFKINSVKLSKFEDIKNWYYPFYSSNNIVPHLNLDINFIINKTAKFNYHKNNFFKKQVVSNKSKIFYVDDYSNLHIISKDSLELVKKIKLYEKKFSKNYALKFSIILVNEILYLSDNLGSIMAINIENYKILWKKSLIVPFVSNMVFYKNSLYVTNYNGKLYSFDSLTGKQNWSYETGTNTLKNYNSYKIALENNYLIFANDLKYIYCLDLDKQNVIWNFKIKDSSSVNLENFKLSDLSIKNGLLYFSSNTGIFYKINIQSGQVLWSNNITTSNNFIINSNYIFAVDDEGYFIISNIISGDVLFKKNLRKYFELNKINTDVVFNNIFISFDKFYITANNGYFVSLNSKNLNDIKYVKVSNNIVSNIIHQNDSIVFIGENKFIYKIK